MRSVWENLFVKLPHTKILLIIELSFSSFPLTSVVYLCAAEEAKTMNELLKALYMTIFMKHCRQRS